MSGRMPPRLSTIFFAEGQAPADTFGRLGYRLKRDAGMKKPPVEAAAFGIAQRDSG
ncbi:MAG: hypothetical protein H0S80_03460 [Desulfovibrionaceae bacterium]|nr:hypothetical protein [Desulfovibrionaceae bacterium]